LTIHFIYATIKKDRLQQNKTTNPKKELLIMVANCNMSLPDGGDEYDDDCKHTALRAEKVVPQALTIMVGIIFLAIIVFIGCALL